MIYIQTLDRYWDAGSKLLKDQSSDVLRGFQVYLAREYVRLVKLSIDQQRYRARWKDLTPGYLEYKRKHGLSLNIWEATGELKKSLKVMSPNGRTIVIGFDKRRTHKWSSAKLYKLARWLEYGTLRIPPRPLFRMVYIYMSSNINYFWSKYQKEEGLS